MNSSNERLTGGCACGDVRYYLHRSPLFVHCCHCYWCQRETGSAFALNAMVESEAIGLESGSPQRLSTPSNSGRGQVILRCPQCWVALWSHYSAAGQRISFLRVGTLDDPHVLAPDIHIFTASKQPWVTLPPEVPAVPEFYRRSDYWPQDSIARYRLAIEGLASK